MRASGWPSSTTSPTLTSNWASRPADLKLSFDCAGLATLPVALTLATIGPRVTSAVTRRAAAAGRGARRSKAK